MAVRVLTDSVSSIPADIRERLDIEVVSLYVIEGGVSTPEVDVDFGGFYDRLAQGKEIPTSAQPSPSDMLSALTSLVDRGYEVIGVFVSDLMSGTFASANMVRDMVLKERPEAKIEIVDSRANSMQEGFVAIAAAEIAALGGSMEQCVQAALNSIRCSRFLFAPRSLEYLRRGGRIGNAAALIGSLIQLTPVLTINDGVADTFKKVRTYPKAISSIIDQVVADAESHGGITRMCVHHITESQAELAREVADRLAETFANIDIPVISLGPVIGTHVGPAVGVVYETAQPLRA